MTKFGYDMDGRPAKSAYPLQTAVARPHGLNGRETVWACANSGCEKVYESKLDANLCFERHRTVALDLRMNSIYGKTAQSVAARVPLGNACGSLRIGCDCPDCKALKEWSKKELVGCDCSKCEALKKWLANYSVAASVEALCDCSRCKALRKQIAHSNPSEPAECKAVEHGPIVPEKIRAWLEDRYDFDVYPGEDPSVGNRQIIEAWLKEPPKFLLEFGWRRGKTFERFKRDLIRRLENDWCDDRVEPDDLLEVEEEHRRLCAKD